MLDDTWLSFHALGQRLTSAISGNVFSRIRALVTPALGEAMAVDPGRLYPTQRTDNGLGCTTVAHNIRTP